jgi:hypothetical protein
VYSSDEAVGPPGDVLGRLSARAAIPEEFPARPVLQDVAGKRPLQAAVVPFDEVGIYFRAGSKAGQFACLRGALQRTGENADKREPPQSLAKLTRVLLATFIQRQIGSTSMLMRVRPGSVTVPSEIELW